MSPATALALAGVLALGAQGEVQETPVAAPTAVPELPPRAPIAGLPGVFARSHITFFEAPDQPHELEVMYVFPQRARIQLFATSAPPDARQLEYRSGDQFFFVAGSSPTSEQLEGQGRKNLELRMELRRNLLLWPDGDAWSGEGSTRTLTVPGAGSLEVALDDAGRPRSMRALNASSEELEAYSAIEWREVHGRRWPHHMEFSYGGARVWSEDVYDIKVHMAYLDWFFMPVDRRLQLPPDFDAASRVVTLDLPPFVVRRYEVDGSLAWKDLLAHAEALVNAARAELEPLGLSVEAPVNFLLSDQGRATHCELRLQAPVATHPPGWILLPERPVLTMFGVGPPLGLDQKIRRLRSLAPADAEPGQPYVRTRPSEGPGGKLQVVLPLVR